MKIKTKPEDFVVSEVADISPEAKGDFALYLLKKNNITTWEALGRLAKQLHIPLSRVGYGGLKDKRAVSHQYITIYQGPKKDLKFDRFELIYLGQTSKPMDQSKLLGNRFEITVRDVEVSDKALEEEVERAKKYGVPNYFDEQRFGSVKGAKKPEFAAKYIIKGDYERALYLALVTASPDEGQESRKFRGCLKKNWRKWENCLPLARLKWEKELLTFLTLHQPSKRTFKRALQLMDREYLFFLGNAYQSYLWNEVLKRVLERLSAVDFKVSYTLGELYFYRSLDEEKQERLRGLKIPLLAPKLNLEENDTVVQAAYRDVLLAEGLKELKELRSLVKGLIFKSYPRPAVVFPQELHFERVGEREVKLFFFLEKGSYATLIVKRIFYACANA
jgi:tRNA pseudouridine13 synthase